MQNRQESLDVASPGQLWFPSLDSASSDSCIVFRKSAYRLRMAVPNLSIGALLWGLQCSAPCCVVSTNPTGKTPLFFFVASITLTLFDKPKQQNQEKCRGGYFRRDNRDQLVPGFQTGPMSTLTGAEWPCARSVLAIITSVSSEDKLAKSKRNTRKHRRQSTRKKPVDMMVTFSATLDAESPRDWPKTTVWPWCKRCDEILRCRIVRFWYSVTGPLDAVRACTWYTERAHWDEKPKSLQSWFCDKTVHVTTWHSYEEIN